jgi:hypothetical protein
MANATIQFDIITDIKHCSMAAFHRLSAHDRTALIQQFKDVIDPDLSSPLNPPTRYSDVRNGQAFRPTKIDATATFPTNLEVKDWFDAAIVAYNAMDVRYPEISPLNVDPPSCVRYRLVDNVWIAYYNFELAISLAGGGPARPTPFVAETLVDNGTTVRFEAEFHMLMTYTV